MTRLLSSPSVNEVRQDLLSKTSKMMEHSPPNQVKVQYFLLYFTLIIVLCNGLLAGCIATTLQQSNVQVQ